MTKSFRRNVFLTIVLFTTIVVSIISLFLLVISRNSLISEAKKIAGLISENQSEMMNSEMKMVEKTVENISIIIKNEYLRAIYENTSNDFLNPFIDSIKKDVFDLGKDTEGLKALYFYFNPAFFDQYYNISYAYLKEEEFERLRILPQDQYMRNDSMRWFYEPLDTGKGIWQEPYFWELFNTKILTYSQPVIIDRQTIGIVGYDLAIEQMIKYLEKTNIENDSYSFLLNENNHIIVHPNLESGTEFFQSELGKRFTSSDFIDNNNIMECPASIISYSVMDNDWKVVVCMQKSQILQPVTLFMYIWLVLILSLILIIYFISKILARAISKPIEHFAKEIKHFNLEQLSPLKKMGIEELDIVTENFNVMIGSINESYNIIKQQNQDIEKYNINIEAAYSQLEASFNEIEQLVDNLENVLNLTSSISMMAVKNENEFLERVLDITLTIISNVDRGLIAKYDDHQWQLIKFKGFPEEVARGKIIETLNHSDPELMHVQGVKKEKDKRSIYSPLHFGNKLLGAMILTNTKNPKMSFTGEDRRVINAFSTIAASFFGIQQQMKTDTKFRESILLSMIKLVELHDPYTKGHSENVSRISVLIAKKMNLDKKTVSRIEWGGLVHDIGKILIPKEILTKPTRLTDKEYDIIRKHPEYGFKVLEDTNEIHAVANIIKYHHERWDGGGYPEGLEGEEIPMESRIVSLADAFDAMASDRPYRKGLPLEGIIQEISDNADKQFDPEIVKVFLEIVEQGLL